MAHDLLPFFSAFIDIGVGTACLPAPPPPSHLLLALLLGVLVSMPPPANSHLVPVSPGHEAVRRFDDSPVLLARLFGRRVP